MASTGNFNVAARRTALGDRNVASRDAGDAPRDDKPGTTRNLNTASSTVVSKAQENRVQTKPKNSLKKTFLQPAQRPPKARTIAPSISMSHIPTVANKTHDTRDIRKALGKSRLSPWVYVDEREEESESAPAEPARARAAPEDRPVAQAAQVQPSTANQYRKQEPVNDILHFLGQASMKPKHRKPQDEQQPSHFYDHEEVPPQKSTYSNEKLSLSIPSSDAPSPNSPRADDDITEPLYSDAYEHLTQFPDAPEPQLPVHSLPEPLVPERIDSSQTSNAQPRVSSSNYNNHTLPSSFVDNPAYPSYQSDSDEEGDRYDDQGFTTAHSYRSRGDNTTGGVTTVMFPPRINRKGQAELEAAKRIVESGRTAEEIQEDAWDVSMVAEYGDDIFHYMKEQEMNLLPNPHYMDNQGEIQWSMRSVLMDWVVQVHTRFGLLPETLFLTVNYIDRFLSHKIVSLGKLQLVGATAIFIAAKYEEINCPSVQEIVYMVDGGYTTEEILKAERFMLSMLDFELGWPGPMSFLRRISKADDYDLETRTLAKYFLEVVIMDERFVASPPSYIAAGAHCLSRLILGKGDWTPGHVHYSGYTYDQLKPLVTMLLDCCRHARKHHSAVFEKYSDKRYRQASTYVEEAIIVRGYTLPFEQRVSMPFPIDFFGSEITPPPPYTKTQVSSHTSSHAVKLPIPTHG
ncbi:cyclin-like protein [Xylaria longipes]|nr:cyclin-like protein [Xylaria longipes]